MVLPAILQTPIVLLLDQVLNTSFIFIILVCIAVTIFFDLLRHPGGSTQFMWRHWWHTPLLALILFPVVMVIPPIVSVISPLHGVASVAGAAAVIFFLWAFITSGDPFSLPSDSAEKTRILKIAKKLLTSGGFGSLSILSINSLLWFPSLVWVAVLIASLLLYTIGFLLRYNASRSPRPKGLRTPPPDPSQREPRRGEPEVKW
ncbi:MAG: hypothetical protein ACFFCO_04875 [Promethearchaeota archaeon]